MSYRDFDRGTPPEEIHRRKQQEGEQDRNKKKLMREADAEHARKLIDGMKAWHERLNKLEVEMWQEATGSKSLPPRLTDPFFVPRRES